MSEKHFCGKVHRKQTALVACMFPKTDIYGAGEYASEAPCGRRSIYLYPTEVQAQIANTRTCGGQCIKAYHSVYRVTKDGVVTRLHARKVSPLINPQVFAELIDLTGPEHEGDEFVARMWEIANVGGAHVNIDAAHQYWLEVEKVRA